MGLARRDKGVGGGIGKGVEPAEKEKGESMELQRYGVDRSGPRRHVQMDLTAGACGGFLMGLKVGNLRSLLISEGFFFGCLWFAIESEDLAAGACGGADGGFEA